MKIDVHKENTIFWIDNFQTLSGEYYSEDDYWLGYEQGSEQMRLAVLFNSFIDESKLRKGDIITLNFNTQILGFKKNLQNDTSSYTLEVECIKYNLEHEEQYDGSFIPKVTKWIILKPLLDFKG